MAPTIFVCLLLLGLVLSGIYVFFANQLCVVEDLHSAQSALTHLLNNQSGLVTQGSTKNAPSTWIAKFFCEAKASDIALVFFTWCLVVVTAWLGWATLKLWQAGERQIKVAAASAKAAQEAADTSKLALTHLQRPFVFVKEIDLHLDRAGAVMGAYAPIPGAVIGYKISAMMENSGSTPATRVMYNFNCGHVSLANLPTFNFPDQGPARPGVLGPKATLQTWSHTISAASMGQVVAGIDRWFVWGWVDYDGIFEGTPRHRTEFCFEVKANMLANGEIFMGFPMHDKFNATDSDCLRGPAPYP